MAKTVLFPPLPVLVVDDELTALQSVKVALMTAGINNVRTCSDSREARELITREDFELAVLDLTMPYVTGQELLSDIVRKCPQVPVLIVTSKDDLSTAVNCMQMGALDYLVKPIGRERLVTSVQRAIDMRCLRRENDLLRRHVLSSELDNPEAFDEFDSMSPAMRSMFRYVEAIALSPSPVLITGETGTGKEVMARAVHRASGRTGQFIAVNVAGIDTINFSDTLFGHKKGAFTGALDNRAGIIEQAAGGSLFLDEIGDLTPELQIKLLRLLQEHEYMPLGSDIPKHTDARVIVATNRDLEELRDESVFRSDLYYRLCHHHVHLPALRDRKEDLALLLPSFVAKAAEGLSREAPELPAVVIDYLSAYDFPGNVRELNAMVMEAVSLCRGDELSVEPFQRWITKHAPDKAKEMTVPDGEPEVIFGRNLPTLNRIQELLVDEALARTEGSHTAAALLLGISRQAVSQRMRRRTEDQDDESSAI